MTPHHVEKLGTVDVRGGGIRERCRSEKLLVHAAARTIFLPEILHFIFKALLSLLSHFSSAVFILELPDVRRHFLPALTGQLVGFYRVTGTHFVQEPV